MLTYLEAQLHPESIRPEGGSAGWRDTGGGHPESA